MPDTCLAESFLEQSPACHWVVDAGGAFARAYGDTTMVLGKSVGELLGQTIERALDPERAAAWRERTARALRGELLALREPHGGRIWNVSVFPIRLEGEIRYVGVLAREVTAWSNAEQELRHTVLGALRAMEFERKTMSRFLHDSVGQNLTAMGLQLDLMRMDLEAVAPEVCARIAEVQSMLEAMMEKVRNYSRELHPSAVDRAGLRAALDLLVQRMHERFLGNLRVNVDPSLKLDPTIASAMYHIAQEAVENAVQHSGCSMIEIAVKSTRSGSFLEVKDNGRGFDPADLQQGRRGLGLLSMEHYAAQAGLDLAIASTRGSGTTVRVTAPPTL